MFQSAEIGYLDSLVTPSDKRNCERGGEEEADEEHRSKRRKTGQTSNEADGNKADSAENREEAAAEDSAGEVDGEARVPVVSCDPGRPTRREMFEHQCTHWPFRSWCRHCVRGRATASPHRRRTADTREFAQDRRVPTISFDHCFLGDGERSSGAQPIFDDI